LSVPARFLKTEGRPQITAATTASSAETPALAPWPFVRVGAAIMVVGGITVVLSSDGVLVRAGWFSAFSLYNVLAFTGVGLLWLRLRPSSRVGVLLLVIASLTGLQSLQGSSSPLAHSLGVLADPVLIVVWVYLLITFPTIRLDRASATVFAVVLATVAVAFVPWFFFSTHVGGATPLARCTPACPENALLISNRPTLATHFGDAESLGRTLFSVLCLLLLGVRLAVASVPRRRVLLPIYAVGAMWVTAFGAYGVAADLIVSDQRIWDTIGWSVTATRFGLPLAFAISIIAARSFAGVSLARMMSQLGKLPTAAALQRVTGEALGDPGLRLAFRNPGSTSWVNVTGDPARPPIPGSGRAWREVRTDAGAARAALAYDEFLAEDPELLDAAASAVKISLHARHLESELRDSTDPGTDHLTDDERSRIGRDLHDGAQQRLVVIGMDLERLRQDLPPEAGAELNAELTRLGDEIDRALDEIREIAHGAFPPVLADFGLRAALIDALRGNTRANLRIHVPARHAASVESAVYFATLEAIQNATKHAGPGTSIEASVWQTPGELWFEVRDDGRGFDPTTAPRARGLAGLSHRLAAVDGTLDVASAPGGGTVVAGCVPIR
jgi:signal transduction histidine kinase